MSDHEGGGLPPLCRGCRWGQIDKSTCSYMSDDPSDLPLTRVITVEYLGACHAYTTTRREPQQGRQTRHGAVPRRKASRSPR